jgi:cobalt-zinc-cadmium efflux system membrane fusion protein
MKIRSLLTLTTLLAILSLGFTSCTKNEAAEEENQPFSLSDTMLKRITIADVQDDTVRDELKLTGKIAADEDKVINVFPLVGGTVQDVSAELGDHVDKGQTLAIIKSGEVAGFQQQLIDAENDLKIAQKNLSVTQDMYQSKLASEKDYITAKLEVQKDQGELARLQQIFSIYNVGSNGDYVIKSPISGYIIDKKINNGMQIRPDQDNSIFTVSDLSDVWVMANVYETDISKVKEGYDAYVSTISYPDQISKGKIDKVYNVIDPDTKVMKVRIRLNNKGLMLKPDMFANVSVHYKENKRLPGIPATAIVFDKSKNFVMVYKGPQNIETREVNIYRTVGDRAYIDSGLNPGEKIIDRYHLLVYDALND